MRRSACALLLTAACARGVAAQDVADLLRRGDSLRVDPQAALATYREALAADPDAVDVLWRVVRSEVDLAKVTLARDAHAEEAADSIFARARVLAERAIAIDSLDDGGHFALSLVLGEQARTKGGRERVRYGRLVYEEAAKALELNPDHPGAEHVLGAWHAEVRRLSRIERFFARTFLGGGFLSIASRDSAVVHLTRAVALDPTYLHHRLDLAEVLIDLDRDDEARAQLVAIRDLPDQSPMDPWYREDAERLLERLSGGRP